MKKKLEFLCILAFTFLAAFTIYWLAFNGSAFIQKKARTLFGSSVQAVPRPLISTPLGSENILPGIKDPIICAQIAKEHFLMVQEAGADDADWRIEAYEDALSVHMHELRRKKNKREYFLLLQEFFPYRLGTYPDIQEYLSEVAEFPEITPEEKEKFFALVDERIKFLKDTY